MLDFAVKDTWRIFRIMGEFVEGFETLSTIMGVSIFGSARSQPGTLDELFEAVTLIQTKKVKPFPVILVGEDDYWDGLIGWIEDKMVRRGKVRPEEVQILQRARSPREVLRILKRQARQAPRDRTGRTRAGKEIP